MRRSPAKTGFRAAWIEGIGARSSPALKSCQSVADQVWGLEGLQIAGKIPWRRLGAPAGLSEKPVAARSSGATVLLAASGLRFGLAFFDLLGPLWPPPPCALVLFPGFSRSSPRISLS